METLLLPVLMGPSVIAFIVYARDKRAAMMGRRRIPERSLHLLGLLGGWPGALLARKLLNHKTTKTRFVAIFWATVIANITAVTALFGLFQGIP